MEDVEKILNKIEGSGLSDEIREQANIPRGANIGLDENDKEEVRSKIKAIVAEQNRREKLSEREEQEKYGRAA
jgi:hypothetical protein